MTDLAGTARSAPFAPEWTLLTFPMAPEVATGRIRVETLCALARSRGVGGLDLFAAEIRAYGVERTRRALRDTGLRVSSLIVLGRFLTDQDALRRRVEGWVALARRLDATRIMIVPADAFLAPARLGRLSEDRKLELHVRGYSLAVEVAAGHGIEILFEDTPTIGTSLARAEDCRALLDRVPGLGFVFDTANVLAAGGDPIASYQLVKDRIRLVHVKDADVRDRGVGDRTVDGRVLVKTDWGAGVVPLPRILRLLAADGYAGPLAIEYRRPRHGSALPDHAAQLDRFLGYGRALVANATGEAPAPESRPFRWAYIGSGAIARTTARGILRTGRHEITAVHSRTVSRNAAFARRFGARASATVEQAVLDDAVDAVYLATPANTHADLARTCLALGKPVLVEKPFTVDADAAAALFVDAGQRGVYLAEAMWTWFSPVARRVRAWVEGGVLGEIHDVDIVLGFDMLRLVPRLRDPTLIGGALLDLGIYATTYAVGLFGVPDAVDAEGTIAGGVDTEETITFRYAGGPTVRMTVSITRWKGERLVIRGSAGSISVPFFHGASRATLRPTIGRRVVFRGRGGFANEFDLVASEIRAGRTESAFVPPRSTIENLRVLDEIRARLGITYGRPTTIR